MRGRDLTGDGGQASHGGGSSRWPRQGDEGPLAAFGAFEPTTLYGGVEFHNFRKIERHGLVFGPQVGHPPRRLFSVP